MNIGSVVYTKEFLTGKMTAVWNLQNGDKIVTGTGIAQGDAGATYSGTYRITYYTADKTEAGSYILKINEVFGSYYLNWYCNDILKCSGIGMLNENRLIAGWSKIMRESD